LKVFSVVALGVWRQFFSNDIISESNSEFGCFSAIQKKSIAFGFYLVNTDGLPTRDGQLHVQQEPDAVLDSTTQQWSLVLSCGIFIYLAEPLFPVEWLVGDSLSVWFFTFTG